MQKSLKMRSETFSLSPFKLTRQCIDHSGPLVGPVNLVDVVVFIQFEVVDQQTRIGHPFPGDGAKAAQRHKRHVEFDAFGGEHVEASVQQVVSMLGAIDEVQHQHLLLVGPFVQIEHVLVLKRKYIENS